jgi:hypothetical protein
MAVPNLSEVVTTTIENRSKTVADNVSKSHALLDRLEKKGKAKPADGGRRIIQELEFAENGTFGWYSGYDALNISPQEVFSAAEFDWKQCAVAVSISGLEQLMNSGDEQFIDLLESRMGNAERSMKNQMGLAVYGDGTAAGGKAIGGLQLLIADTATTGTVGNINRANWSFWRNQSFGAVADYGGAATTANIVSYMNRTWMTLVRGNEAPDLIMADNNYYRLYMESLLPQQRFTSPDMAQAGFQSLKFQSADVVFDGGIGGGCPTNHMYFMNTDYIYSRHHPKRRYVALGEKQRFSTNQDAMVQLMGWAGNMTLSGGMMQGLLHA